MAKDQNLEEVLIARNNETGEVGAVTGLKEDGTPQMTDVKSAKLSDLVKFQKEPHRGIPVELCSSVPEPHDIRILPCPR